MKMAFERAMNIPQHRTELDQWGSYIDPEIKNLWLSFKAGVNSSPTRGNFVVAQISEYELPLFPAIPEVHEFKDVAIAHCRQAALATDEVHVVYQQISRFDPLKTA